MIRHTAIRPSIAWFHARAHIEGPACSQLVETDHRHVTADTEMIVALLRGHGARNHGPRAAVVLPGRTVLTQLYKLAVQTRYRR